MESFFIGELDPSSPISPEMEIVSKKQTNFKDIHKKFVDLSKQYWVVPVSAVGISVIMGLLFLRRK